MIEERTYQFSRKLIDYMKKRLFSPITGFTKISHRIFPDYAVKRMEKIEENTRENIENWALNGIILPSRPSFVRVKLTFSFNTCLTSKFKELFHLY